MALNFPSTSSVWRQSKEQYLKDQFIKVLAEVPTLQILPKSKIDDIADSFSEITFQDGDVIIQEGELGDNMYILKSGKVSIYKRGAGAPSKNKYIRTLEPPSFFGEYALVSNSPRTASVVAIEPCTCYILHKEAFACLFPANLIMRCKHFLEDNQIFEKHRAFCRLPQLVISHLRSAFRPLIFTEGNIVTEIDRPQHFCICVITLFGLFIF